MPCVLRSRMARARSRSESRSRMASPTTTRAVAETFPQRVRLPGGETFELRLMEPQDRDGMVSFAQSLPPEDTLFLRTDITEPRVVDEWLRNIAAGRTATVVVYDGPAIVGFASVHHNEVRWTRHIGEVRTIVGKPYRGMRLGVRLVREIFAIAQGLGLKKITAHMTVQQAGARAAFERIGFQPEAVLCDYVIDAAGQTHDMVIMSYDVEGLTD